MFALELALIRDGGGGLMFEAGAWAVAASPSNSAPLAAAATSTAATATPLRKLVLMTTPTFLAGCFKVGFECRPISAVSLQLGRGQVDLPGTRRHDQLTASYTAPGLFAFALSNTATCG
jgi:hypothetical protein